VIPLLISAAAKIAGPAIAAANQTAPTSLESGLNAKTNPIFSSSFAVGSGANATSEARLSEGLPSEVGGLPTEYLLLGGFALVAILLVK
jgi:hypothetical protein